jgi:beta-phosphoglucomutase-like phosphatase (HAD superfamily)
LTDYLHLRIRQPHFANARSVRNALDRARLRQASRLFADRDRELTAQDLSTIGIHDIKTAHYEAAVRGGGVALRPGVLALMRQAQQQGLRLAIATTTSPVNIAALLRTAMGPDWRLNFAAIGDASTAPLKKPHPQVYLQMVAALGLPAGACLAFEDSGNGLQAATAAGLATVITPTRYTQHHDFSAALRVLPDLGAIDLPTLARWHATRVHQHKPSRTSA